MWFLSMEQKHEIYERENWEKVSFLRETRCTCATEAKQNDSNAISHAKRDIWPQQEEAVTDFMILHKVLCEMSFCVVKHNVI